MSASAVLEHAAILCIRGGFFLGCRRYLIHSLYADLQDLSLPVGAAAETSSKSPSIELETLPMPSGASAQPPRSTLHFDDLARRIRELLSPRRARCFFLLLCQGMSMFQPRVVRLVQWKILSLALLLVNIILTIPSSISLVPLCRRQRSRRRPPRAFCSPRLLLNLIPVVLYLSALSYIPLPGALAPTGFVAGVLARLLRAGTTILGLLSGFGAISSAWPYLPFVNRAKSLPTEQDLRAAEHSLDRIRADLATLNGELTRTSASSTDGSWISRVATSFRGGDSRAQEMKGLRALEAEMSRNFDDLTRRYQEHTYRRTFRGRVVASALHLLFPSNAGYNTTTSDLLTDLLAIPCLLFVPGGSVGRDDLGLVGVIILMSLRLVLRGVTR
ncbi:hypothetical protein BD626DRAFT_527537, partial [Schizophyllum amplum]